MIIREVFSFNDVAIVDFGAGFFRNYCNVPAHEIYHLLEKNT